MSWFEKRHIGDVLSRFQSIVPIQQALTQGAVGAAIDGLLAVLTLALMLFYSVKLTLIAVTAFAVYGIVRGVSFAMQREAQQEAIVSTAKEQSVMVESVRGIITLRLFNRETIRHSVWQSRFADEVNANIQLSRVGIWQTAANTLIFGVETILSIWLAIGLVISGGFSVGMVFAFLAYKTQFTQRGSSLIDQLIAFRMLGLHLDRLSDIALAEQDVGFAQEPVSRRELKGKIELRGVRFRYSETERYVLDGVDLVVEPGEHIAITGPSGGGKSTLVKIILGLLEPECGEVLIDDIPLKKFGYANYREQVGAVLQEDNLFAGSIADNIALFDDMPDMDRIVASAQAAAIYEDIAAMPMAYETLVGDMGSSLSGGQKQRVQLARCLYRAPSLLVMDEGTAHLDVSTEQQINARILAMGITRIIIAHRQETTTMAEKIFFVADGQMIQVT